jgi:hypothetical protein
MRFDEIYHTKAGRKSHEKYLQNRTYSYSPR